MAEPDKLFLDAYKIHDGFAPEFLPARSRRPWMDDTIDRVPYRCLPMTIANATGWELNCPFTIDISWDGGAAKEAIKISSPDKEAHIAGVAESHFQNGIVTFHTGYLFRTPPGWAIWAMGPPNWPIDGISPLSGLIETDWLPFTFTMNWQMTRPGTVRFNKGDPFCFLTLSEHRRLEDVQPKIKMLAANKQLHREYSEWRDSRSDFNAKLERLEKTTLKQGWQRHYMRGEKVTDKDIKSKHNTKRVLKKPIDMTGAALLQK